MSTTAAQPSVSAPSAHSRKCAPSAARSSDIQPPISIRGLTERYGSFTALNHLTLDVNPGEVLGFLGLNRAGKTTTIRLLLDLLRPTSGKAFGDACRPGVAGATTGLLALAAFLLDYIGRLWPPADKFTWLSPFRYFVPFDLVMSNPVPVEDLVVLWAVAMTGFVVAYLVFSQRDVSH